MADASTTKNETARRKAAEDDRTVDAGGDAKPAGEKQARGVAAEAAAVTDTKPREVATGDAAMVGFDEENDLSDYVEDSSTAVVVVVKKDVWEEFYYPLTTRPSHRLLYKAGQTVNRAELEERLALIRAAKAVGSDSNPAGIDPTTLASGTYPGVAATVSQEQSPQGTSETK